MYRGEITLQESELVLLLATASELQVDKWIVLLLDTASELKVDK